jgi:tetratricopeptide (TPR) repeat protein
LKLGWLDLIVQKDMKEAINKCEQAVRLFSEVKDTLSIGQSWEQMSTIYGTFKDFENAQHYFELAIPILKRLGDSHLGSAYHNYANLLAYQRRSAEALPYEDSAINIARKEKDARLETVYLTNRGLLLYEVEKYDEALAILKNSMAIDEKNQWLDNLVYDYNGMADTYYEMGNYKAAYDYKEKKHTLQDSLTGVHIPEQSEPLFRSK